MGDGNDGSDFGGIGDAASFGFADPAADNAATGTPPAPDFADDGLLDGINSTISEMAAQASAQAANNNQQVVQSFFGKMASMTPQGQIVGLVSNVVGLASFFANIFGKGPGADNSNPSFGDGLLPSSGNASLVPARRFGEALNVTPSNGAPLNVTPAATAAPGISLTSLASLLSGLFAAPQAVDQRVNYQPFSTGVSASPDVSPGLLVALLAGLFAFAT